MKFLIHAGFCFLSLLFIWGVLYFPLMGVAGLPLVTRSVGGFISMMVALLPYLTNIVLIVYYYRKKYSLFALPVSHFLFSIFFFFANAFLIAQSADDVLAGLVLTIFFFGSLTLITLVVSIILKIIRDG
jgi:hypothetical protein